MTTSLEYALMAGASYISTRAESNIFPAPSDWVEKVTKRENSPSGFEATYFINGTEVVISYAGTDDLTVGLADSVATITIQGFFSDPAPGVERFITNDHRMLSTAGTFAAGQPSAGEWEAADAIAERLITAMAQMAPSPSGTTLSLSDCQARMTAIYAANVMA